MINPKKFLDKIKEEVFYYFFKHNRFDLKEMQTINKSYTETWNKITVNLIVWTAIISVNLMSLIYVNTFLNVSFWQNLLAVSLASWIMRKGFDKFIAFKNSLNRNDTTKQ